MYLKTLKKADIFSTTITIKKMKNFLNNSLELTNLIINNDEINNINFYNQMVESIGGLYKNCSLGIFFCENLNYNLKAAINQKEFINEYHFNLEYLKSFFDSNNRTQEIKTKKDKLLYSNTYLVKLAIKDSVFGFCFLSCNEKFDSDIKISFETIINVLSYKIKDYELKSVFRMQLKALQDAIVEKENAYEIIKKQHKKLEVLDKTKNLFLANISHELRTPLNAIIGFSQALDSKIFGDLNEKQAEYIKDIQISGIHLLGMINEILDISKLEAHAMKFSPTNINPNILIKEVINILEPLYKKKNIEVQFICGFNGEIKADYQKFQQILFNLLSNAIKFTKEKGKIEISDTKNERDYILKIKDNGIGIEKKYHNKIFKKFVQLNNIYSKNQSSTGLGLTITKELVKLHKGKIILESEPNKGTTFTLEFKKIVL